MASQERANSRPCGVRAPHREDRNLLPSAVDRSEDILADPQDRHEKKQRKKRLQWQLQQRHSGRARATDSTGKVSRAQQERARTAADVDKETW